MKRNEKNSLAGLFHIPGLKSIIMSSFALGVAFGGYIPLQSLWLESLDRPFNQIGLTNGIVGLGIVISAYFVPRIVRRVGITRAILIGLFLAIISASVFRLTENLHLWLIIKFIKGLGLGLHWVLSEAWLIKISPPKIRPKAIAIYAVSMSLGFAGGPAIIWLFGHTTLVPFFCVSLVLIVTAIPFFFIKKYEPSIELESTSSPIKLILKFPTVVAACVVAGGIDLAMLSLLPAIVMRLPTADVNIASTIVTAMAIGTIAFQYPIAKLVDHYKPEKISAFVVMFGVAFAGSLPFFLHSFFLANGMAFLGAGLIYGLYTLGLTMLSNRVNSRDLVTANAGFVIIFEMSNLFGPTVAGILVDISFKFGFSSFVFSLGLIYAGIYWLRHGRTTI
ncbi:MAG: MFS transporter [Paracoccaceae bacterium]